MAMTEPTEIKSSEDGDPVSEPQGFGIEDPAPNPQGTTGAITEC